MQRKRSPDPMSMLECSLQGLWSLTELDLSYCNIQMIPDVLGSLSSLKELNLKGNNFVCIPESIIQLTNLDGLYLINCTDLQSLPRLPLNIRQISLVGCISLETIPESHFQPRLDLIGCSKITEDQGYNDMISMMQRRYLIQVSLSLSLSLSLTLMKF